MNDNRLSRDEMFRRARERTAGFTPPAEWGERVDLEEEDEVGFFGRYLGTATDPEADAGRETVYLFSDLDRDGGPGWFRYKFRLARELEGVPVGAVCVITRGENELTASGNEVHTYGVSWEESSDPLPEAPAPVPRGQLGDDDELPF